MYQILCLMVSGGALTNNLRTLLYVMACNIARRNERETSVTTGAFEGVVLTAYQHAALGGTSGIIFSAKLDFRSGETVCLRYIVHPADIEDGDCLEWLPRPEVPAEGASAPPEYSLN